MRATQETKRKSRARRVLGVLGVVVGTSVTFVSTLAVGALAHLDLPATRRLAADELGAVLRTTFKGRIAIEKVEHLGLDGVRGVRARVSDATGRQVVFVDDASAEISAVAIVRSALVGEGDIDIAVRSLRLDYADVNVEDDGSQEHQLRLLRAFEPIDASPPPPKDPTARGTRIHLQHVALRHGWIHGAMHGAPHLDLDADGLEVELVVASKETRVDLSRLRLGSRGMPNGANPRGDVAFHLEMPSKSGRTMGLGGRFDGDVGGVIARADFEMDGDDVDGVLDVPRTEPERLRAMLEASPLREPFAAHAEAHGSLSKLGVTARVDAGEGHVALDATVGLGAGRTHVAAKTAIRDVDVRAFSETAPASRLGADLETEVAIGPEGALRGTYTFATLPSVVGDQAVPITRLSGEFTEKSALLKGGVAEPGIPVSIDARMREVDEHHIVDFTVAADAPAMERAKRLMAMAGNVRGAAKLRATGTVDIEGQTLDARLSAELSGFEFGESVSAERAVVTARARGALANPGVDANVHATKLALDTYDFRDVRVSARGVTSSPWVTVRVSEEEKTPAVEARARIDTSGNLAVRDARIALSREGVRMDAVVKQVKIGPGSVAVEGVTVEGLGAPATAAVRMTRRGLSVRAESEGIDLEKVARLAKVEEQVSQGVLAFAIDASLDEKKPQARAELTLERATLARQLENAGVKVSAALDGDDLAFSCAGQLGDAARFEVVSSRVKLGGERGPLDPDAWARIVGSAAVSAVVDLGKLEPLVPRESRPFGEMKGIVTLASTVRRDSAEVAPEGRFSINTRGLVLAGPMPPEPPPVGRVEVVESPSWRTEGVDVGLDVRIDATSGLASVATRLSDEHGAVAVFDAKAELPYDALWRETETPRIVAALEDVPVEVRFQVPRRKLDDLPPVLGAKGMVGDVEVDLRAKGTAREPDVTLAAHLYGMKPSPRALAQATDADVTARYDGRRADAQLRVRARPGQGRESVPAGEVLTADARADVALSDLLHPKAGQELPWTASARAKLASFPLESIGALADKRIRGALRGELVLERLHEDARARARLDVERLRVGDARYTGGFVEAEVGGGRDARAVFRLQQSDGFFEARAKAVATWGAAIAPELDETRPIEASVAAKHFRVVALEPFLAAQVSALDGYLDADARARLDPKTSDAKMSGKISFRQGMVNLPALGDELRGVRADVTLSEDGTIRVDDVVARGMEGRLTASASAKLEGTTLERASAKLRIAEREAVPLSLQGESVGAVFGKVDVDVVNSADGKMTTIDVNIPSFHTKLPPTPSNSVQDLDKREDVRIGVKSEATELRKLPMDQDDFEADDAAESATGPEKVTEIRVRLGKDVEITRATDVRVSLTGAPTIRIGAKTEMSGQLQLTGGFVELQGKKLEIEKGTVSFVGEADNPILVVTARYDAPDGTMIYADFVGPLKTGKVSLRSEPPRPQSEIVAVLMFGTAEGSQSTPYPQRQPDGTMRAVGMGGSYATQGLNKGIADLAGTDRVTAHIDTSRATDPRAELEFQLARRLSVKIGRALGVPPIDRPDRNFLIFGWRVRRNWTLETTFGDKGTSIVDGVWQYRY